MSGEGFDVRIYCVSSDGVVEPLMGADINHFQGAVPNVGDTYAMWHLRDSYKFYNVQRRYFVDSADNDHGWVRDSARDRICATDGSGRKGVERGNTFLARC